eukprot:4445303-Prymnesium_polylepis.1
MAARCVATWPRGRRPSARYFVCVMCGFRPCRACQLRVVLCLSAVRRCSCVGGGSVPATPADRMCASDAGGT